MNLLPIHFVGGDEMILGGVMAQKMTESDMADLYEEMLYERAAKGIRPVLYVSSHKDLECSVLMLLDEALELQLSARHESVAIGIRQNAMTN